MGKYLVLGTVALALFRGTTLHGQDNAEKLEALNSQVEEFYLQGSYDEAIDIALESLTLAETTFGPDSSDTATSLNNLAALYKTEGRYE